MIMIKTISLPYFFGSQKTSRYVPAKMLYKPSQAGFKRNVKPLFLWTGYILLGLNVVLMFWYLLGVNSYAASGYEINKMQKEVGVLTEQNQKLTLEYSEKSSLISMQSNLINSQFVPVVSAQYIQVNQLTKR